MGIFPDTVSAFEIIVGILGTIGGLYTLWGLLRPLKLDLYPADTLSLIASNTGFVSKFHLRCNLVNKTTKMGIVHLLEAEVRLPTKEIERFRWRQLFKYQVSGNGQTQLLPDTELYPIEVKPKDSHLVFIEFQAIRSIEKTKWIPGYYDTAFAVT